MSKKLGLVVTCTSYCTNSVELYNSDHRFNSSRVSAKWEVGFLEGVKGCITVGFPSILSMLTKGK